MLYCSRVTGLSYRFLRSAGFGVELDAHEVGSIYTLAEIDALS
jgi:hypothetical protein